MTTLSVNRKEAAFLPYGCQQITENDISAVVAALRSDLITQGPLVPELERALAEYVGAAEAVIVSSGTAALHLAMLALDLGPGDWILTSPNTFLATPNAARFVGAEVSFCDIQPDTGLINPELLSPAIAGIPPGSLRAIVPVHFAGQPVNLDAIGQVAEECGVPVICDGCHALGAQIEVQGKHYRVAGDPYSTMTVFSFHPVKHVAMGEGGAVCTNDPNLAKKLRLLRNHGMQKDDFVNTAQAFNPNGDTKPWYYEMQQLGYNYRVTELQAALGLSQLTRIEGSVSRRSEIAEYYRRAIGDTFDPEDVRPLENRGSVRHAYHLFVLLIDFDRFGTTRSEVMRRLRAAGIGTQVHYIPVHLQPYYAALYGHRPTDFPGAMQYYEQALSIPMYPMLRDVDCQRVIDELKVALGV